jgi:5-methylcytosine-specific restriction endonuclease McrA
MALRTNPERMAINKEKKRLRNIERLKALNARMTIEQPERLRELRREASKRFMARRPDVVARRNILNRFRGESKHIVPAWGQEGVTDAYIEAQYMQMDVDHIIPLNHPLVCGLHVWDNLQILTKSANRSKRNKFDPDTFVGP